MDLNTKSWNFLTNMTTTRLQSSSVAVKGSLFVTGGWDENPYSSLSSTEYVTLNGNVLPGPDLPWVQFLNPLKIYGITKKSISYTTYIRRVYNSLPLRQKPLVTSNF